MKLVIVESPAKAKKIAGYLGDGWQIEACRGHVRDLPESQLGVDVEQDFRPQYVMLPGKGNLVERLVKLIRKADEVYLATDPDREGEAIAWHLLQLAGDLKNKPVYRAAFHAITEEAVQAALADPRPLDAALVEAQSARRVVDRLVGYLVSPLACKTLDDRLSAGRVQSVALRLVVEREQQIAAFQSDTTWGVEAILEASGTRFEAKLHRLKDADIPFKDAAQAEKLLTLLKRASFWVSKTGQTTKHRNPLPPFTTSTLQQVASKGLGLSPEKTMSLAQMLYEQGRITYHRTDSVAVAQEAQTVAREVISREYGERYLPTASPIYKAKTANAQEAHEAIRPTDISQMPAVHPEGDVPSSNAAKLYDLIWRRFIASQMTPADYTVTAILIRVGRSQDKPYPLSFKANGRELTFDGFLRVYEEPDDVDAGVDAEAVEIGSVPSLRDGQILKRVDVAVNESQTRPPSRYSEAALVQALEKYGVGRPSTFASMVAVIKHKKYVTVKQKHLVPTKNGMKLCAFLIERFPQVFDMDYTARLEAALDQVASGQLSRSRLLNTFWRGFQPQLKSATEYALTQVKSRPKAKLIGETCPDCGGDLVERQGANGVFVGCTNYPSCTYTRSTGHQPLTLHPAEGA
ncbi:type I DNA topoisomerase [Phototrophicus methaneseepsis]|uniref:DNA topoisomerase 1 n=1 Tax=Phototrophicus methaneseepsis TaxID=2710758 RepID=A0A7S8EB52_9CHLR|nr:type I DNA topoisomerase [Phototrophicus methaneseepsis]QPC83614.1 type I DNA topoisomerase [Phototrophicus methaneseepsis]